MITIFNIVTLTRVSYLTTKPKHIYNPKCVQQNIFWFDCTSKNICFYKITIKMYLIMNSTFLCQKRFLCGRTKSRKKVLWRRKERKAWSQSGFMGVVVKFAKQDFIWVFFKWLSNFSNIYVDLKTSLVCCLSINIRDWNSQKKFKANFLGFSQLWVFLRLLRFTVLVEAPWSSGECQGLTVWAMVLGCGFNSRVHLKTRWIRWTTWWQKKNENN